MNDSVKFTDAIPLNDSVVRSALCVPLNQWEMHKTYDQTRIVGSLGKGITPMLKAAVAAKLDEMGIVASFFPENGKTCVVLEGVKQNAPYKNVEVAFEKLIVEQILGA